MSPDQRITYRGNEAIKMFLIGMALWASSLVALALSGATV
jgi:hypothetical protein